jgi:DNA polymerase-3 subunit beta
MERFMKVVIPRTELVTLIGKIQNVVPTKPSAPILGNILIEAVDDQLIISATDLTVSMRVYAEAKVLEEGAITLPARRFFQLIRELTSPQVEIHCASSDIAFINAGTSHFKIHGMHKNEFPTLPEFADGAGFAISAGAFKEMLSRTVFAAAKEDSRQLLNAVCMQRADHTVTFTGTDGKRLAKLEITIDIPIAQTGAYILPLKAVEQMIHILDAKEESVKVTLTTDKIALEIGSITFISKLLVGQYPDVGRVIPDKKPHPLVVHREELISLLRQVSLFISEESSAVRFTLTSGNLHLSANSGEIGEGTVSMPINYGGEKLEIAFNPHYFIDILRHSKDETVHFGVTDSHNPGLITDSSTAQFVIMPMRLE